MQHHDRLASLAALSLIEVVVAESAEVVEVTLEGIQRLRDACPHAVAKSPLTK
jgi:hypothetical protein